jgi:serine/threonine-protein kinase
MAMELLDGESLERRLVRRGRLTPSEVAHVLRETARGVDRAHAAGIIHRDLKPPNVFLARVDGVEVVKVLDFGIAKMLGPAPDVHLQTQNGFVVGTPAYMSPEQVLGRPIDHRSDLWQLAIVAFECLTGTRPFDGGALGQLFMAICSQPIPVPSSRAPVPPGFDAWFARAASRDPAGRFSSAGEMADALGTILAPGGVGESAIATVATSAERPQVHAATGHVPAWSTGRVEPTRRGAPVALIAGMLLAPLSVLVLGGAVWLARQRAEPKVSAAVPEAPSAAPPPPVSTEPPPAPVPAASAAAIPSASPTASAAVPVPKPPPRHGQGRSPGTKAPIDLGI